MVEKRSRVFLPYLFTFTSYLFPCRLRRLVGLDGLEPSNSRLSGVRSNHLSYKPIIHSLGIGSSIIVPVSPGGGDDGVRTHDPLLAGQVLSQLSYTPMFPGSLSSFSKIVSDL